MKYLCMIYSDESLWQKMTKAEADAMMAEYMSFGDELKAAGQYVLGQRLQPVHTATTVRVRDGKLSTTDGPYAETKEQLGGYYLVDAVDLNEAIRIASRIPGARVGAVEVRPLA